MFVRDLQFYHLMELYHFFNEKKIKIFKEHKQIQLYIITAKYIMTH